MSEGIDQVDGRFGGTEVVAVGVFESRSAGGAAVLLVVYIEIAHSDGQFQAPPAVQQPVVAVADAASGSPSLVAVVFQRGEEAEGEVDAAGVELSAQGVDAPEVAVEGLAGPVAELGLDEPVLQFAGVGVLPGLQAAFEDEGVLASGGQFESGVGRAGGSIEQVGLQYRILRPTGLRQGKKE